ncbi:MAG: hypothetical protein L3J45_01920 [Flavobacteriaceae bacterium]|nr:hypothetical protein [Flavobacteriaceae bacterium]
MKYIPVIFLCFIILSCNKQTVKLPQIHTEAVNEVYNNSQVWIFYSVTNNDTLAVLNKNNSISTTHWLFNIDKKLQLKQLYKPLSTMLAKRQKKSPHHVDGMRNYFTFADTLDKRNKFLPFKTKTIVYKVPNAKDTSTLNIIFYPKYFQFKDRTYNYHQLDSVLQNQHSWHKTHFFYQDQISYPEYLKIKALIYHLPFNDSLLPTTDFYFE